MLYCTIPCCAALYNTVCAVLYNTALCHAYLCYDTSFRLTMCQDLESSCWALFRIMLYWNPISYFPKISHYVILICWTRYTVVFHSVFLSSATSIMISHHLTSHHSTSHVSSATRSCLSHISDKEPTTSPRHTHPSVSVCIIILLILFPHSILSGLFFPLPSGFCF